MINRKPWSSKLITYQKESLPINQVEICFKYQEKYRRTFAEICNYLDSSAISDSLVWIDAFVELFSVEEFLQELLDLGNTR